MKRFRCFLFSLGIPRTIGEISLFLLLAVPASAQITPDSTLLNNSIVNQTGTSFTITGGTTTPGGNLFHSFQQFSVPIGGEAFFNHPLTVRNLISRVTGGTASNIDGMIRARGTANFFLINPAGIVFGSNARLSIGGSFIATTASSLKLSNGDEFSVIAPSSPLLTISVPIGLQFGRKVSAIQLQNAQLSTRSSTTLALIGGDLAIARQSSLSARGGNLELGSMGPDSLVSLIPIAQGFAMNYGEVQEFRNIQIQQSLIGNLDFVSNAIQLKGKQVTLEDSALSLKSPVTQNPGSVLIGAEQLVINNSNIQTLTDSNIPGPDIVLAARDYLMVQGSSVSSANITTQSTGTGKAGNLTLRAGTVDLQGAVFVGSQFPSGSASASNGASGDVLVAANRLTIQSGARIFTLAPGRGTGGPLTANIAEEITLKGFRPADDGGIFASGLFATTVGSGRAGTLTVNTRQLTIEDGANINAVTENQGDAGRLTINATDRVLLSGSSIDSKGVILPSAITVLTTSRGAGGVLEISTGQLIVRKGAQVSAGTLAAGPGGTLTINASQGITLEGSDRTGLFARSRGSGNANQLTLNTGELIVRDQAQITASGESTGNAGNLIIRANTANLEDQGRIVADSVSGQGGNIELQVNDLLVLRRNSQISTSAGRARGGGDGGNITISAPFVVGVLAENSDITANAFTGRGGNITINTQGIFGLRPEQRLTPLSDITASSQFGLNGTVTINSLNFDPSKGLEELTLAPVDASRLVVQGCNSGRRVAEGQSRFVILGRGGLSASPDDWFGEASILTDLGSPVASSTATVPASAPSTATASREIVEAQGLIKGADGEIYLVNYAANPPLNGVQSSPSQCQEL